MVFLTRFLRNFSSFFYPGLLRKACFLLAAFSFVTLGGGGINLASAQPSIGVVQKIVVEGNQRIETAAILSHAKISEGEAISRESLDAATRMLFDTSLFADVHLDMAGSTLVISVVENPIVNQLVLEGNSEFSDEILMKEMRLRPRDVYTQTKVKADTKIIYDLYRLKGHFAAQVTPRIIKREQNRVDVVFEIVEGQSTPVRKINFLGNKNFSEGKLEALIQTKETRWYRFFTNDDTYDPDRLSYDRELLRQFYLQNGYADFQVKSAVAELSPDQKEFFITFTIEEGERYRFGNVGAQSDFKGVTPEDLEAKLTMKGGDWYNSKEIENTITAITGLLGDLGYPFVDIHPRIEKKKDEKHVNVTFEVKEGPRAYIDQIKIVGNTRTEDEVIRRELLVFEGDAFSTHKLKLSERRLKNLGFFKKVELQQEPSGAPDKINLVVAVEEQSTGEASVGFGFSTSDGPMIDFKASERNLRGKGQEVTFGATMAKRRKDLDIGFTEPYFLDRPLAAGFNVFASTTDKYFDFTRETIGARFHLTYNITENLSQQLYYRVQEDRIKGVGGDSSRFLKEQRGNAVTSAVGQNLLYDRTDMRHDPTMGYFLTLNNEIAGLGGAVRYSRNDVKGAYFIPVTEGVVFSLVGRGGIIFGLGRDVRISDRYVVGGETIRGFDDAGGIGPRDRRTQNTLGGQRHYSGTAELKFPLGLPDEFGVRGIAFVDAGTLWQSPEPKNEVNDSSALRASAGAGVRWTSPLGVISIYYAKALKKESFDETQSIHFAFGTRY